jgi:GNAT superfamily N-acetyltransferase
MTPRNPWETQLAEYLRPSRVVPDLPEDDPELLAAERDLEEMGRASENWRAFCVPGHAWLEIRIKAGDAAVIFDRRGGEVIGGNTRNLTYVRPAWRGLGLAAELHVRVDLEGLRPIATHYSESGLHARIKAHRLHVERAILSGRDVPDEVLDDYRIDEAGRLALLSAYGPSEHRAWISGISIRRKSFAPA